MSVSGGLARAIYRARELTCDTAAIFSRSPRIWKRKLPTTVQINSYFQALHQTGIHPVILHGLYLANLASPDDVIYHKSIRAISDELAFCAQLSIPWLVIHPGSHLGHGESGGMRRICDALDLLLDNPTVAQVGVALETTSGSSHSIGGRFEHFQHIIHHTRHQNRIGVCLDTCHIFSAGYDIQTNKAWNRTRDEFHRIIGLDRLVVVHLNDSLGDLGSHLDRHTHIGEGRIGVHGFRAIVNDPALRNLPMILETPKDPDGLWDIKNLSLLRGLR